MIDNIKFKVLEKEVLESHIKKNKIIDLKTSLNLFTGEESSCPLIGKYFNLDIVIACKGAYIKGSVHKMKNLLNGMQSQNYNDLTFCSASESIRHLIETFGLNQKTSLTNLEFGLNIRLSQNPQNVLDYNLLMYDFGAHNKDLKFRGKGDYKEFQKTDYYIKIYNKSKQYKLYNNILRIEMKIISKRKLQKLGIFSLEDLENESIIRNLYSFLWNELHKLTIVDDFTHMDLPFEDLNNLNLYTNPNYWKKLRRDRSFKVVNNRKQKLQYLITKYGLDSVKKEILKNISEKFAQMIDCFQSSLKMAS